ncbi:MAG: YceD family protein [Acidimicrobiales bacterium]
MAIDPFDVALGDLRDRRAPHQVVRRGRLAEALEADVDCRVPAGAEAVADVVLDAFDGGVAVSGQVCSSWEGECRRCLGSTGGQLGAGVREVFRRGGGQDEGTYPMGEDRVNLREMVLDSLFAALPVLPLCRGDCQGICAGCGADRNVLPCDCAEVATDQRWAVLDVLREEGGGANV